MIQERLSALREEMKKRKIDIYIVPTADFHESEYVGEHFKARKFITGFTGSAGTAVITLTEAGLWTDGRYFVQAEKQLAARLSSGIAHAVGKTPTACAVTIAREDLRVSAVKVVFDHRALLSSYAVKQYVRAECGADTAVEVVFE